MILKFNIPVEVKVDDTYPFRHHIDEEKVARYIEYARRDKFAIAFEVELLSHALELVIREAIAHSVADTAKEEGLKAVTWLKARDALQTKCREFTYGPQRHSY